MTDTDKAAELIYGAGTKMKEILPGVFVPEDAWLPMTVRVPVDPDDVKNWVGSNGQ